MKHLMFLVVVTTAFGSAAIGSSCHDLVDDLIGTAPPLLPSFATSGVVQDDPVVKFNITFNSVNPGELAGYAGIQRSLNPFNIVINLVKPGVIFAEYAPQSPSAFKSMAEVLQEMRSQLDKLAEGAISDLIALGLKVDIIFSHNEGQIAITNNGAGMTGGKKLLIEKLIKDLKVRVLLDKPCDSLDVLLTQFLSSSEKEKLTLVPWSGEGSCC